MANTGPGSSTSRDNADANRGFLNPALKLQAGVDPQTLQLYFLQHRHGGTILDGQAVLSLNLVDTITGYTYKLTIAKGVLTPVRIK